MKNNQTNIKLRTIFAGTPSIAGSILTDLISNNYNIIATITQPDKKSGRKQVVTESSVKQISKQHNIPVLQPEKLTSDVIDEIKKLNPDLIIVAAYGKILPQKLLDIPGFGCINVHTSLLPELRGPSPIQNALLLGKEVTGATIMLMDAGVDTGDILSQSEVTISPIDNTLTLSEKLAKASSKLLLETIPLWISKSITPQKQDSQKATLCQLIEKSDGKIFWNSTAKEIYNKYRAFIKWPGVFCFMENGEFPRRLKLNLISISDQNKGLHFGEVFKEGDQVGVQTSDGVVFLEKIQLEGKKETNAFDFINGQPDFIGSILK